MDAGDLRDLHDEPFELLPLEELGLDNLRYLLAAYSEAELAAAVKPYLLAHLLEDRSFDHIAYLGADLAVYSSLEDLTELARQHEIALAPRLASLPTPDDKDPTGAEIFQSGGIETDFFALARGELSSSLLSAWKDLISAQAAPESDEPLMTEHGWFDKIPLLYRSAHVLDDPSWCVSYSNLPAIVLRFDDGRYLVDDRPLRVFHFAGFDPEHPYLLSREQGDNPRVLVSGNPTLAKLCDKYAERLLSEGFEEARESPYSYGRLSCGLSLGSRVRHLFRSAVGGGANLGDIFTPDGEAKFIEWLNAPADLAGGLGMTRFLYSVYDSRDDLKWWLPNLDRQSVESLKEWAVTHGRHELDIPPVLLPWGDHSAAGTEPGSSAGDELPVPGINVVGFLTAELGLGEVTRKFVSALDRTGVPLSYTRRLAFGHREGHEFEIEGIREATPYPINLICLNGDGLLQFKGQEGEDFFLGRYNIGLWWWEVPTFPDDWRPAFDYVDEIWVGSPYIASNIAKVSPHPVVHIPVPVVVERGERVSRADLDLPDDFLFLFVYDFYSTIERKNPVGLIEAFKNAFEPGDGATLILKSIGGDNFPDKLEMIRAAVGTRPDVRVIDEYLSAEKKDALFAACDCYVSLHRAEGFGITLADAMYLGKPVIGTAYSGNMEFMNAANSYLVNFGFTDIPDTAWPYPPGPEWAEPDLDHASKLMRHVLENREEAQQKAEQAAKDIRRNHSLEVTGNAMLTRLREIGMNISAVDSTRLTDLSLPSEARDSVNRLAERISAGVQPRDGRRGPRALARKAIGRTVRPYATRQREVDFGLLETIGVLHGVTRNQIENLASKIHKVDERAMLKRDPLKEDLAAVRDDVSYVKEALTTAMNPPSSGLVLRSAGKQGSVLGYKDNAERKADPSGVYIGLEEAFRSTEEFVRDMLRPYVALVRNHEPVLDIGCGRGEFLDLLRQAGIEAEGIDIDEPMVAHCAAKGHTVRQADSNSFLRAADDASFGCIFSSHVIEHLPYDALLEFLELSEAKLRNDGILIATTVNPYHIPSQRVFWLDPTHQHPLFPEVMLILCRIHGFSAAYVLCPHGDGDYSRDRLTQPGYAVVAAKKADVLDLK